MKQISINDTLFSVYDEGSGPCLLFVHGFPLTHHMWQQQLEFFSDSYRVIAPDLRGFGSSDLPDGTVTMKNFADDCVAILDTLEVTEPVTYVGLSMGGYIGWEFWRSHQARTKAMILCDTRSSADSEEAKAARITNAAKVVDNGTQFLIEAMVPKLFCKKTIEENKWIVDSIASSMKSNSPFGVAAALEGMADRVDSTELLKEISVPTLFVVGEDDKISPQAEMEQMAEAAANGSLAVIPDAGHMAPCENPDAVNQAMKDFLSRL